MAISLDQNLRLLKLGPNNCPPMATSISTMLIPLSKTQHEASFPSTYTKSRAAPLSLTQNSLSLSTRKLPSTICKAFSEVNSSLSSTVTGIEGEEEQDQETLPKTSEAEAHRLVGDVWRQIHGEKDWVGLLDPMDPLLLSELIRYCEMAQACYDAFDFDPYSKYCGGCRSKLFECLGMTHFGFHVTRYLYATANVNLPNFFKRLRWPNKMWSKNANWAGYIAVSDDATSKRLGRRDIAVAWRGTVTHNSITI